MAHEFKIGTSAGSMTLLSDLGIYEPFWEPPVADQFELGDAQTRDVGWAEGSWHWGFMGSQMYDALKVFVPGRSATVFIRTKTSSTHYEDYQVVAEWPKRENWVANRVLDITLKFKDMTLI